MSTARDRRHELIETIRAFALESPLNRLPQDESLFIFDEPLVGFADGDDPLFKEYKRIIGEWHLTPRQALVGTEGDDREVGGDLDGISVISWILPISEHIRSSNRAQSWAPTKEWIQSKYCGEPFNDALRRHVPELLAEWGHRAVAPLHSPLYRVRGKGIPRPPASNWSERHIAYAAGLGTFGLSEGLITPRSMAMRCGSVVTDLHLEPNPRPYASHTEGCLFLSEGTCGACIERCPAGAITAQGHDKSLCSGYIRNTLKPRLEDEYGIPIIACGLCQTGVPCERGIPGA